MESLNENNQPTKCVLQLVLESENIVHYDEIRMCPSPRSFEENLNPLVHLVAVQRLFPLPPSSLPSPFDSSQVFSSSISSVLVHCFIQPALAKRRCP